MPAELELWKTSVDELSHARFVVESTITQQFSQRDRDRGGSRNRMTAEWESDGARLLIVKTLDQLARTDRAPLQTGLRTEVIFEKSTFARYTANLRVEVATEPNAVAQNLKWWKTDEFSGGFLDGRIFIGDCGPISVFDVLSDSATSVSRADSGDVRVLKAVGADFTLDCAIDPKSGHVLRFHGSQLHPGQRYQTFTVDVDGLVYERVPGLEFVSGARLRVEYSLNQGGVATSVPLPNFDRMSYEVASRRFAVSPNFTFSKTTGELLSRIPDGTAAVNLNEPDTPVSYTWKQGTASPRVNLAVAQRMKDDARQKVSGDGVIADPFAGGKTTGRMLRQQFMLPTMVALAVFSAWWGIARWHRRRSAPH